MRVRCKYIKSVGRTRDNNNINALKFFRLPLSSTLKIEYQRKRIKQMEKEIKIIINDKVLDVIGLPDTMVYTVERRPDTYNGWTNYATWRIQLELFDGNFYDEDSRYGDIWEVIDHLKEYAHSMIEECTDNSFVQGWAYEFLDDVNWYEIAQHLIDNCSSLLEVPND